MEFFNEFLSMAALGVYLKTKGYNLPDEAASRTSEAGQIAQQLYREMNLQILFFYEGGVNFYDVENSKLLNDEPIYYKGYVTATGLEYFLDHKGEQWKSYKGDFTFPSYFFPYKSPLKHYADNIENLFKYYNIAYTDFVMDLIELNNLKFCDLKISKSELDHLLAFYDKTDLEKEQLTDNNKLQAKEIAELKEQLNEALAGKTETLAEPIADNSNYTTTAITALNHVIKEFWQDWEIGTTPVKQDYIVKWIVANYPTIKNTTAINIDRIARHETAK